MVFYGVRIDKADDDKNLSKTWNRTRIQNLVRHRSGRYYARFYEGGKERWLSLKTSHFGIAKAKLATALQEHRQRVAVSPGKAVSAKMTFGEALAAHKGSLERNTDHKESTPLEKSPPL